MKNRYWLVTYLFIWFIKKSLQCLISCVFCWVVLVMNYVTFLKCLYLKMLHFLYDVVSLIYESIIFPPFRFAWWRAASFVGVLLIHWFHLRLTIFCFIRESCLFGVIADCITLHLSQEQRRLLSSLEDTGYSCVCVKLFLFVVKLIISVAFLLQQFFVCRISCFCRHVTLCTDSKVVKNCSIY